MPMPSLTDPHGHDHAAHANERRVFRAMWLTGGFMLVELAGGLVSGSLALVADAAHMLTDAAALGIAWYAFRIARRPADPKRSFGYHRAQVLAAFVNGAVLVAIVFAIVYEAVRRLAEPAPVMGATMLAVALAGLAVNAAAWLMLRGGHKNLNVRGAALHVAGDFLASLAAVAAAVVILATGWTPIDPALSLAVSALVLWSGWSLVRKSAHILLQGTPDWLDVEALGRDLAEAVPGVVEIHHVHVWSLTSEQPVLTLHAVVDDAADPDAVLAAVRAHLMHRYGIGHTTIQVERLECPDATHEETAARIGAHRH
jgi:cobalt-zinc-cadmium efflux system protein